jgi:hypothetical protein
MEFRRAATLRYDEARGLATTGHALASVYLFGYSAEMLLKAACFRLRGKNPTDRITMPELQAMKAHAKTILGLPWPGNLHDLTCWRNVLIEERKRLGHPYHPAVARSLVTHVDFIYANWREDLRYRTNRPYSSELSGTYQAVTWIMGQYRNL